MVVNGMSNSGRSTPIKNTGLVVQVTPEDLVACGLDERHHDRADVPVVAGDQYSHLVSFERSRVSFRA